jgi:hypothetical protein
MQTDASLAVPVNGAPLGAFVSGRSVVVGLHTAGCWSSGRVGRPAGPKREGRPGGFSARGCEP